MTSYDISSAAQRVSYSDNFAMLLTYSHTTACSQRRVSAYFLSVLGVSSVVDICRALKGSDQMCANVCSTQSVETQNQIGGGVLHSTVFIPVLLSDE